MNQLGGAGNEQSVLPRIVEGWAATAPERRFIDEVGGGSCTYGEAHAMALVWAGAFRSLGVEPGDRVLTMLPTSIDAALSWLGLGWCRAIEVPINTAYQGRMLEYLVNNSAATIALISSRYVERFRAVASGLESLKTIVLVDSDALFGSAPFHFIGRAEFLAKAEVAVASGQPKPHDICAILYTSGTTGPSKGVMVPWRQMHQTGTGLNPGDMDASDVFYIPLPLFHIGGKGCLALMASIGGRVLLREQFSTDDFWADVDRFGCTTVMLLGGMARFLEAQDPKPDDADHPLRNTLLIPLVPNLDRFRARFGVRAHTWFGMSEVGIPIAVRNWDTVEGGGCGSVRDGFEARIVDDDDEEVADGQIGELVVRSKEPHMLNAGYWGMPEKTVEAWRNLWLHTGDAMVRDAGGNFRFVDRWKDALRRRGENISSMEVEAAINEYDPVLESAVIGVPSEWGEDEVMAIVVAKPGCVIVPEELVRYLLPRSPSFMIPRFIRIVGELPKTPTQKVRKVELKQAGITNETWDRESSEFRSRKIS
jgi:crotonobetaine/carnitine-CoA ligase